nr:tyrosine-type recombinase/integrase [Agrobacterium sp. rho-8.1]
MTSSTIKSAVDRRAEELDTIASVLPLERRDELAELLTDQDIETLRHLVNQGMGDNTLRALTSDLAYLEAWGLAATGKSLPWPAPEALLLNFVAHHLGEQDDTVYLTGRPVDALNAWMTTAKIDKGSVFRGIGRWGTVSKRALDPQSINAILKQRAEMAGLDSGEFSAHGLRSGYLTEAANRGIPLPEAMEQSRHRSVQQASSYYNNATRRTGRSARML